MLLTVGRGTEVWRTRARPR